jgi:hypothetical protein
MLNAFNAPERLTAVSIPALFKGSYKYNGSEQRLNNCSIEMLYVEYEWT